MEFLWNGASYDYKFQTLTSKNTWSNTHLNVDGVGLGIPKTLTPIMEDITNLILFGSTAMVEKLTQRN